MITIAVKPGDGINPTKVFVNTGTDVYCFGLNGYPLGEKPDRWVYYIKDDYINPMFYYDNFAVWANRMYETEHAAIAAVFDWQRQQNAERGGSDE